MALHARMKSLVEAIHQGALGEVKHLIHIGIGGSALGPKLAIDALTRDGAVVDVHVVANIDGCAMEQAIRRCDPATTLIAVASKTFTTIETMTNAPRRSTGCARMASRTLWPRCRADRGPEKAVEWGVDETRVLPLPKAWAGVTRCGPRSASRWRWPWAGTSSRSSWKARPRWTAFPRDRWRGQPAAARGLCRSALHPPARLPDARLLCL
jgi:hypothetical protein